MFYSINTDLQIHTVPNLKYLIILVSFLSISVLIHIDGIYADPVFDFTFETVSSSNTYYEQLVKIMWL